LADDAGQGREDRVATSSPTASTFSTPSAGGGRCPMSQSPTRAISSQLPTPAARTEITTSSGARDDGARGRACAPCRSQDSSFSFWYSFHRSYSRRLQNQLGVCSGATVAVLARRPGNVRSPGVIAARVAQATALLRKPWKV